MLSRSGILNAGICSIGGLIFGYDLGAISAVALSLRETFHLSPLLFGLTMAASLGGTVCGSIMAGRMADKTGRHMLLGICAALYLIGAGVLTLPVLGKGWTLLVEMRFLCGSAIGGFTVVCPLYLAEIAPSSSRGAFVGSFQLQVGIGVLLAFVTAAVAAQVAVGEGYWRLCLGLGGAPSIALLLLLRSMAQSPRWLASRNRWNEANLAANRLGLTDSDWQSRDASVSNDIYSHGRRLFSREYRRPLLLATSVAVFNQLSGVNILLFYLLDILSSAGLTEIASHRYTVFISGLNLGTTVLSMFFVDKFGRKPLLLLGSLGMAACLFGLELSISHHMAPLYYLIILVAYNMFFAFSQGTIIWIFLSELFPFGVRGAGQGYGSAVLWVTNTLLVLLYPLLQRLLPTQGLYLFSAMMILQIVVVVLWYPETKGRALGVSTTES